MMRVFQARNEADFQFFFCHFEKAQTQVFAFHKREEQVWWISIVIDVIPYREEFSAQA